MKALLFLLSNRYLEYTKKLYILIWHVIILKKKLTLVVSFLIDIF